jgi:hypothetical protein
VPLIDCPAINPVVLDSEVTCELPAVTMPVGLAMLVALAFLESVIVAATGSVATTVVLLGIFVPVIDAPGTTLLTLDTPVTVGLPLVVKPVAVTVLLPLAGCDKVIELAEIWVM